MSSASTLCLNGDAHDADESPVVTPCRMKFTSGGLPPNQEEMTQDGGRFYFPEGAYPGNNARRDPH